MNINGGGVNGIVVINGNQAGGSPPASPSGLLATPSSTSQIDLVWVDNAVGELGYKVYRSTDGVAYVEIDDIAPDSESYADTTVVAGTTYWYQVAAYNGSGESSSDSSAANTLTLSMISVYEGEQESGNRADSHDSNTLTDNNTVTRTTGVVGYAMQFDAANSEYLSRASNPSLQTGDIAFLVCFWAKVTNAAATQILVAKYGSGNNLEYRFDTSGSRFRFLVSPDGVNLVSVTANTFGAIANDTWYMVMGWHDPVANTINISVNNGTPDSTAHAGGVFAGAAAFTIGASAFPATYTTGAIDQVFFVKRNWVATEKASIYNGGAGRPYSYIAP